MSVFIFKIPIDLIIYIDNKNVQYSQMILPKLNKCLNNEQYLSNDSYKR